MNLYLALKKSAGSYMLGIILGLGATVAWVAAVMLVSYPLATFARYGPRPVREYMALTVDGEALLVTAEPTPLPVASKYSMPDGQLRVTTNNERYTYRTLEAQPVEIPMAFQTASRSLIPATEPRPLPNTGPQIRGFLSAGQRPAYWYAVFQDDRAGHTYFIGFDPHTRLPFGYLTTTGFRVNMPAVHEQFKVNSWVHSTMAPGGGTATEPSEPAGAQFLVSDGKLYAIDFDEQSVQPLPLPGRIVAIGVTAIPLFPQGAQDVSYEQKIVVRLPEELVLLNRDATEWRRVPMPSAARERPVMLYGTLKEEMVLEACDTGNSPQEMYWISGDGKVARRASIKLSRSVPSVASERWMSAGMFPAPWIHAVGELWFSRPSPVREPSILERWLPISAVCLVSTLLAIPCYRRDRAVSGGRASIWSILVFLLGPPGLIGYLAHRPVPPKSRCEHCGAVVPRDREACRACGGEFPPPALRGIEIFA